MPPARLATFRPAFAQFGAKARGLELAQSAGPIDHRLARALSHPLRLKLLAALNEGVASPNQLANRLGEPLANVSYHVRILLDLDCIELVETAQRRGAIEHFYRALAQ